ncbi:MAG TPA: GAF domain-containing protein [Ktedonobacterales bacterium]|nr:GAF domain-containing protein [Ktedonobacterales bacterium]
MSDTRANQLHDQPRGQPDGADVGAAPGAPAEQASSAAVATHTPHLAATSRRRSVSGRRATHPPAPPDAVVFAQDAASPADTTPTSQRRDRKTAGPALAPTADDASGVSGGAARTRRVGAHGRESGVLGLGERARNTLERRSLTPLLDPLLTALPGMRHELLNTPIEDGLRALAQTLAATLAPAAVQCWLTDPASWSAESGRVGGAELAPALRLRATAAASAPDEVLLVGGPEQADESADAPAGASDRAADGAATSRPLFAPTGAGGAGASSSGAMMVAGASLPRLSVPADPLIAEVVASRRPVTLFDADTHPLAVGWLARLPEAPTPTSILFSPLATPPPPPSLGSLVAYPLRARGQFLGVMAVAARARLAPRQLGAIEEICDLVALATDRDRLLSYSRSQEALAQTVVRQAPVAMAVLTGADHIFALANPTFALLLGLNGEANLIGRRLAEITPEHARSLVASLRLDAVYAGGEPQGMIELPIHQEDGLTYWNITSSPLAGVSTAVGGVMVAAVNVTWQVLARRRAQDAAEMAQDRIGQMMALHATTLATAGQLGDDPRNLLTGILRRSISLLNARAGVIYARNPRRDELEVMVCEGLRGDYTGGRVRVGEGLAGQVALTGQGLIVDDYRAFPYRTAIYEDEAFSAVIAAPLIHHGQVVGVLDVLDDAEKRVFSDDDLWLLDLFAAQAAQTIENARTFVELESAYRKQRDLDRMKDDFIATASHELRTPLTGVQGFLDLLIDYMGEDADPMSVEFAHKAADSAQELADISERLLQTSRLDSGRGEAHTNPVRLGLVIEESLRSFRALQEAHGTTHTLVAEVAPDVYAQANLGRLKDVLDNLIGNAIKYSPQGGRVTVRCALTGPSAGAPDMSIFGALYAGSPNVMMATTSSGVGYTDYPGFAGATGVGGEAGEIAERPTVVLPSVPRGAPGGMALDANATGDDPSAPLALVVEAAQRQPFVVVTVGDEGMGVAPEERSQLFGRFSRLDSARESQIRGTGLGLYICRQTMRAMGGDVWLATSAPGQGSVFAFALPAATLADDEWDDQRDVSSPTNILSGSSSGAAWRTPLAPA